MYGSFSCYYIGFVWFVANCVILCLRLVVQIEKLTLDRKVSQSMTSWPENQTYSCIDFMTQGSVSRNIMVLFR
jgi:hypothetical protein